MANYEFPPIGGGAGNAHLSLLKEYAQTAQLTVDVLTSGPKPGFYVEQFSQNIAIYRVGLHKKHLQFWARREVIEWLLKAGRHYRRLLRKNSYDLIHVFFGFPTGWLCYRSSARTPYIVSLRGSDVPGIHSRLQLDYKILGPVFKAIWRKAAALVACSEGLKKRALAFLPSASIDVIANGVDLDRFHPAPTNGPRDTLRLITVGRLSVTKRVELLMQAVEILHETGCAVRLTIVGGGALEKRLREYARRTTLRETISITGTVDPEKMPEIYRQNDVFVSASAQEGMSNAMLEAMASGLPIVTTPCEGVDELISDNGIVVQNAAPPLIAEAIRTLAADEQRRRTMSHAAGEKAKSFAWPSVADQYIRCYKNVLGGPAGTAGPKNSCAE